MSCKIRLKKSSDINENNEINEASAYMFNDDIKELLTGIIGKNISINFIFPNIDDINENNINFILTNCGGYFIEAYIYKWFEKKYGLYNKDLKNNDKNNGIILPLLGRMSKNINGNNKQKFYSGDFILKFNKVNYAFEIKTYKDNKIDNITFSKKQSSATNGKVSKSSGNAGNYICIICNYTINGNNIIIKNIILHETDSHTKKKNKNGKYQNVTTLTKNAVKKSNKT